MNVSEEHTKQLRKIQDEWNLAEQDIKIAEQVVHKIVFPAIKELRYGGRRIVDALHIITSGDQDPDGKFKTLLAEAEFDCHRARHDAVDAASAKIAADLETMTRHIGHGPILQVYPKFADLVRRSMDIRTRINESRGKREDRAAIYASLEGNEFPVLVREFNEMKSSENMMKALAKKDRWTYFYGKWGFWIGLVALVLVVAIETWHQMRGGG